MTPEEMLERMARATDGHIGPEEKIQAALQELADSDEDGWRNPDDMVNLVLAITELEL